MSKYNALWEYVRKSGKESFQLTYTLDNGYILIDTGYDNVFVHFKKQLEKMKIDPRQIRYIF